MVVVGGGGAGENAEKVAYLWKNPGITYLFIKAKKVCSLEQFLSAK